MSGAATHDFGYRSLGPGFLAQLYTNSIPSEHVDYRGGDVLIYSRRKKHRLDDLPSRELIRAILTDALAIVEYAIRDLVTTGEIITRASSSSMRYSPNQLKKDLDWLLLEEDFEDGKDMGYTLNYCCEILNIHVESLRAWVLKRYLKAQEIAREIKSGKRPKREKNNKRRGYLHSGNPGKRLDEDDQSFFCPLE